MDSNKVDMFMLSKGTLFPNAQLPLLREMLIKTSDEDWVKIYAATFKNPTTALIMSLAVGTYGADRFYLGQPLLGVGKLLLTILFIAWIVFLQVFQSDNWILLALGLVLFLAFLLWYLIDIFLVSDTARKYNFKTILTILNQ